MTIFVYKVNGQYFPDIEPWGKGWKSAKELATEKHLPIYRLAIRDIAQNDVSEEVYISCGAFLRATMVEEKDIKFF